MMRSGTDPTLVRVGVAAVVEKVSTLTDHASAITSLQALREVDRAELRVLITLRSAERVLAGHWELPGGKLEADESAEQAVVRELFEEVGIMVEPMCALTPVEHAYEHAHVRLLPYVCRRVSGQPSALEVDAVRWVSLDELDAYRFPQASWPVVTELMKLFER